MRRKRKRNSVLHGYPVGTPRRSRSNSHGTGSGSSSASRTQSGLQRVKREGSANGSRRASRRYALAPLPPNQYGDLPRDAFPLISGYSPMPVYSKPSVYSTEHFLPMTVLSANRNQNHTRESANNGGYDNSPFPLYKQQERDEEEEEEEEEQFYKRNVQGYGIIPE